MGVKILRRGDLRKFAAVKVMHTPQGDSADPYFDDESKSVMEIDAPNILILFNEMGWSKIEQFDSLPIKPVSTALPHPVIHKLIHRFCG